MKTHDLQTRSISGLVLCPIMIFLFSMPLVSGQATVTRKTISATRIQKAPHMDGSMSDPVWELAAKANNFFQFEPHNDREATFPTEVSILYDDFSIYIGARMYDPEPDKIFTELGLRDADSKLNADQFWVDINPFNDGIYGFRFKVSASGVQTDINLNGSTLNQPDTKWDAVWNSYVSIDENGWTVEMEVPYAALRFPKGDLRDWGINFWREVRRKRETSSWNPIDKSRANHLVYMGLVSGIEGVDPPLRLAFYPYVSTYLENDQNGIGWNRSFNGGMDIKYGLNESFTLDMTLIPDFGQVQSDALVLNLTPFEVKYDEKRQFFTEGIELYNKADLFYSRRIGTQPKNFDLPFSSLNEHETITYNPLETRLLNAAKLSGRTPGGLGIGIFNSITAESRAVILDTLKNVSRDIVTQPLTNYSVIVLDQSLPNNSFISLINTNVTGSKPGYIANVTGTEFTVRDKSKRFTFSGTGAVSQQYNKDEKTVLGHKYDIFIGKTGGNWQYYYNREVLSDRYDQNDLGFQQLNNEIEDEISISYNVFKPFWKALTTSSALTIEYSRLYEPKTFTGLTLEYDFRMLFASRYFIFLSADIFPLGKRDYFEPRVPGRFYETGSGGSIYLFYSTDYRKRVYADGSVVFEKINSAEDRYTYSFNFLPTLRISDRFNISYALNYQKKLNDIGYVYHNEPSNIIFGLRNSPTIANSIKSTYIFNNNLSLDLSLRQYWSRALYQGVYYLLEEDGSLSKQENVAETGDISYNAFTIDMKLVWNFSPGSQLSVVWKNLIDSNRNEVPPSFLENLTFVLKEPQVNSLSMKILYYIDYQKINKIIKPGTPFK